MNKVNNAIIKSTGSYLPKNMITNDELAKKVETNNEWIISRTGIKQRYLASENEFTSDLASKALINALTKANISPVELDTIIVATTTPDYTFPSTAVLVQAKVGAINAFAFDIQAVCAGFLYALEMGNNLIITGRAKNVAIIGAEVMSRIVNWEDRTTCVLFGDGAGAIILTASDDANRGIIDIKLKSDGKLASILQTTAGPSSKNDVSYLTMKGPEVYKHAVEKMTSIVEEILIKNNWQKAQIDWLIPHQANIRIINAVGERLGISAEKTIITVDNHANTSAATIPLALDYAISQGKIKPGDKIAFTALGGGLAWGAGLVIY